MGVKVEAPLLSILISHRTHLPIPLLSPDPDGRDNPISVLPELLWWQIDVNRAGRGERGEAGLDGALTRNRTSRAGDEMATGGC